MGFVTGFLKRWYTNKQRTKVLRSNANIKNKVWTVEARTHINLFDIYLYYSYKYEILMQDKGPHLYHIKVDRENAPQKSYARRFLRVKPIEAKIISIFCQCLVWNSLFLKYLD